MKRTAWIVLLALATTLASFVEASPRNGEESGLKLSNEGPRTCYVHRNISYKIIVENVGDRTGKNIEVIDTLPELMEYVESTPSGSFAPKTEDKPATVTWQLGDIAPKGKLEIILNVRAKSAGRCVNSVKLLSKSDDPPAISPLEAVAETTILTIPAMHISTYDTEDPVEVGKETIYVVEIRNEGTSDCTGVKIKSAIPAEMELIKADGPTSYKLDDKTKEVVFEPVALLHPGEKRTYKMTCKTVNAGSAKHTATLTYDQFERPIIDEEGTSCYK